MNLLEHKRKFILGILAISCITILALIGQATTEVCYSIAGIAGSVSVANAIAKKNGKN